VKADTLPTRSRSPDPITTSKVLSQSSTSSKATYDGNLARKTLTVFLSSLQWVGIALLAMLVMLLVGVSVVWGPTPLYLSLPLAAVWLGLMGLLVVGPSRFGR
jgi:hypothetical protein